MRLDRVRSTRCLPTAPGLVIGLLAGLLLLPAPLRAQEQPGDLDRDQEARGPLPDRWRFELSLEGFLFDNFFQAPEDREETTVKALRAFGEIEYRPDDEGRLAFFVGAGQTRYDSGLEDAELLRAGVRLDAPRDSLDLTLGYQSGRPVLDVADELGIADVFFADGEYGRRIGGDFELKAILGLQSQDFAAEEDRDNTIFGVGPAIRYRGFGSGLSPEIGVLFGSRSANDPTEDHSQTDLYVKVRSIPAERTYLSFRYRRRIRDYSTGDPTASNFGREDRRNQWTALLVYPTGAPLALNVYYAYQDAESTLATRTFTTQLLMVGVSLSLE